MTDKARELLERALICMAAGNPVCVEKTELEEEILAYLAQPEVKREALNDEEIDTELSRLNTHYYRSFEAGVRFAEKHHGVSGGGDE